MHLKCVLQWWRMAASVAKFTFGIIKLLCQVRSDDLEVIYVGTNPIDVWVVWTFACNEITKKCAWHIHAIFSYQHSRMNKFCKTINQDNQIVCILCCPKVCHSCQHYLTWVISHFYPYSKTSTLKNALDKIFSTFVVEEKKRNNHLKHSAHANILWQEKCQTGYSQKKVLRIIFLQSRKSTFI